MTIRSATVAVVLTLTSCNGSAGDATPPQTSSVPRATDTTSGVVEVPETPVRGVAMVVLADGTSWELAIVGCDLGDQGADPDPEATLLVDIQASSDDPKAALDIKRYRSEGAAPTITDTVTIVEGDGTAPIRVLVAQRFEVGGLVTDGRDPDVTSPLLLVSADVVTGAGLFAPPGNFAGDGGLLAGAIAVHCA